MKKIINIILIISIVLLINTVGFAKPSKNVVEVAQEKLKTFSEYIHPKDPGISGDVSSLRLGEGYEVNKMNFEKIKDSNINESTSIDSLIEFKGEYLFTVYSGNTEIGNMKLIDTDGNIELIEMSPIDDYDKQINNLIEQTGLNLNNSEKLEYKVIKDDPEFIALAVKSGLKDYIILPEGSEWVKDGIKDATMLDMQNKIKVYLKNHSSRDGELGATEGYNQKNNNTYLYVVSISVLLLAGLAIILMIRRKKKHKRLDVIN